ncbi:MAG: hypothetical protein QOF59_142 [Actinomycetota bacterium]|jgi:hypothetical protein|nr:hypothetical protein [Actinomycetota bacterium]
MHSSSGDDALRLPLPRRPYGIETFRVEATVEHEPVHAQWDGRWAIVSKLLCERVELAWAVEEAFVEAGVTSRFEHPALRRSPEAFMLAVVTCCDDIDVVEFEIRGHHRVITSDVGHSVPRLPED